MAMHTQRKTARSLAYLLGLGIALVAPDIRAACQSGAAGDAQLLDTVRAARADSAVLAGNEAAVKGAQESIFASCPCSPQGQQYKSLQLVYLDGLAAASACQGIVKANPTISGTNQYLICIGPVNAALIATAAQIRDIEFSVISSSCTVSTNPPSVVAPHVNVLSAWAQSLKFIYDIKSAQKLLGLAKSVPDLVAGTKAWPIAESARFHVQNPSFADALAISGATEVSAIRKIAQMPTTVQELVATPATSGSTLIIGTDPAISPLFRRPGLSTFPLPAAPTADPQARGTPALRPSQFPAVKAGAASGLTLATAPATAFVSLGFAPLWLPPFLQSYERSRLAQAQHAHALLGLATPSSEAPPPGTSAGGRVATSEEMDVDKLAALNAVLEQNDALAASLEQFAALAASGQDTPELRSTAAAIARLAMDEPVLRARAYMSVSPKEGVPVSAILSSPWYLGFDFASILLDPALDRSMVAASNAFAAIAGVGPMTPRPLDTAAPPEQPTPAPSPGLADSPLPSQEAGVRDSGGGCSPFNRTAGSQPDITVVLLAFTALLAVILRRRQHLPFVQAQGRIPG